jgi:hypothetical protein
VCLDADARELGEQPLAPLRVGGARLLDQRVHGGVRPEPDDDALQEMADPAGPALLTALHAGDGVAVAGEHGEAQVWPEGLCDRAGGGPALGPSAG